MSVTGFLVDGQIQKYDYNSLDNLPNIPENSGTFWATYNVTTETEITNAFSDNKNVMMKFGNDVFLVTRKLGIGPSGSAWLFTSVGQTNIRTTWVSGSYWNTFSTNAIGVDISNNLKQALLQIASKIAYIDEYGQTYYNDLYNALYPHELMSISATFNQGSNIIYDIDPLTVLNQYLTVVANYSGGTTETISSSNYTLSGNLLEGVSTITVYYEGFTDTFNVNVTHMTGYYTIVNNLTGCTTNNSATAIQENTSYTATITASAGYTLSGATATITMGGNILTGVFSNGTISIPSVTGDLVITVVASAVTVSSISAVYTPGTNLPISIQQTGTVLDAYIGPSYVLTSSSDSYSICIPVTIGNTYSLEFSTTDSSIVGSIFRYGFTSSSTPIGQQLSSVIRATVQSRQSTLIKADGSYLIIQLSKAYGQDVISNGYLTLTEINDTVYTWSSINLLKKNLVVTANYSDGSSGIIDSNDYSLSGDVKEGTQTITVSYSAKTTTFNVPFVVNGWLYHFEKNVISSGNKDFGFLWTEGNGNYSTGFNGSGYSYWHKNATEGTSSTEEGSIYAVGYNPLDMSGDFTISFWQKTETNLKGQMVCPFTVGTTTGLATALSNPENIATGWSIDKKNIAKTVEGIRIWFTNSKLQIRLISTDLSTGSAYNVTFPSNVSTTDWHHYAFTRKAGVFRFLFDGVVIFTLNTKDNMKFADQLTIGAYFEDTVGFPNKGAWNQFIDDLFFAEYCKWDSAFNPNLITY